MQSGISQNSSSTFQIQISPLLLSENQSLTPAPCLLTSASSYFHPMQDPNDETKYENLTVTRCVLDRQLQTQRATFPPDRRSKQHNIITHPHYWWKSPLLAELQERGKQPCAPTLHHLSFEAQGDGYMWEVTHKQSFKCRDYEVNYGGTDDDGVFVGWRHHAVHIILVTPHTIQTQSTCPFTCFIV